MFPANAAVVPRIDAAIVRCFSISYLQMQVVSELSDPKIKVLRRKPLT